MDHLRIFGVLLVVLQAASWTHAQLLCYTDFDTACSNRPVLGLASPADCCLGEGFWFDGQLGESCVPCQVYGWMIPGQPLDGNLTLLVEEQPAQIVIQVEFVKGFSLSKTLTVTDSPITAADSVDYILNTTSFTVAAGRPQAVELSIAVDSVALEGNETFELTLVPTTTMTSNEFLLDKLTVIIQDSDTVNIRFTDVVYNGSEAQEQATVMIERTRAIANPVSVRIVPMTYTDYLSEGFSPLTGIGDRAEADDFQTNPIEVTFDPSAASFMDVVIQITQDPTNEADEDFVAILELVDAINPGVVFGRMASIVRIRDDDTIRIGFEMANYRFVEGSGTQTVRVIKEDNRLTEQTFDIGILVQPGNIPGLEEAVQGLDFNISTTTFEFPPENQEYTVDVLVLQDSETEGPEAFKLTVDLPGAVAPGGIPSANVVIEDINARDSCYTDTFCNGTATRALNAEECCFGDGIAFQPILNATCQICVVVGWIGNTEIAGVERRLPYSVNVGYTKGSQAAGTITFDVIQDPLSIGPDDITGVTQSITVTPGTLSSVEFVLVADDISQEDAEVFELRLEPTTQIGGTVFLVDVLQVAIIDGDVACFQFTADQYQGAENMHQVDIVVEVLQGIATPVDLMVTPLEYDVFEPTPNFPVVPPLDPTRPNRAGGDDYNTSAFVITIPATEQPEQVIFSVELFDDDINEAEQVFVLVLDLLDAFSPLDVDLTSRSGCLVVIVDDDAIRIGFEMANYRFMEGSGTQTVRVIKEDDRLTEQTFNIGILVQPGDISGLEEAVQGLDFNISTMTFEFPPENQEYTVDVLVLEDSELEVPEAFKLTVDLPGAVGSGGNPSAIVVIEDIIVTGTLVTESFHCNVIVWELPDIMGGEITGYTVRIYYEVNGERKNDSTVTYEISNSKTNWLAPAALPVDRPLFYQVRVVTSSGPSTWSNEKVLTDSPNCPLAECPIVTPSPIPISKPGRIHLVQVVNRTAMWYPPDSTGGEISLYVVRVYYRSPRFRFKINIHYYTTERDWVALLDGPAERQLFMQVRAQNSAGAGPWSREVRVT